MSYCLTWGKKKKGEKKREDPKRKKIDNNKPSADFKPVQRVLLVFLDVTGRGELRFTFLPSFGCDKMGTRSGSQYSVSRSSVSCQAQISHSAAHRVSQSLAQCQTSKGHSSVELLSLGTQWQTSGAHGSAQPRALGMCS